VGCFALILWTWYGVNFILGIGLHSHEFGGGVRQYVYAAVVLLVQLLYIFAGMLSVLSKGNTDEPASEERKDLY
jgi:hypothetical protein